MRGKSLFIAVTLATGLSACAQQQFSQRVDLMAGEMRAMEADCPPRDEVIKRGECVNAMLRHGAATIWPKGNPLAAQALDAHANVFINYAAGRVSREDAEEQAEAVARQFIGLLKTGIEGQSISAQHQDYFMAILATAGVAAAGALHRNHIQHQLERKVDLMRPNPPTKPGKPEKAEPAKPIAPAKPPKAAPAEPEPPAEPGPRR